jgi:hypothetical protein
MKYILAWFIFISPVLVFAQSNQHDKDSLVKIKWEELKSSWTFGLSETGSVDIRTFNKYKSLFDSTALIASDVDAVYEPLSKSAKDAYIVDTNSIPFDTYAHDIALHFNNLKIESDSLPIKTNPSKNEIIYTVARKITGYKKGEFVVEDVNPFLNSVELRKNKISLLKTDSVFKQVNKWFESREDFAYQFELIDTVEIHFNVSNINNVTISGITKKGIPANPICLNDKDGDGMVAIEDLCPDVRGEITANGCPDLDYDGVVDTVDACGDVYYTEGNNGCPTDYFKNKFSVSFFAGLQINSCDLNLPGLQNMGYNQLDFEQSQQGSLTSPGLNISPVYGGDISWYFNEKRNKGLSIGITYTSFSATYRFNESAIYTFKANDGVNDYRRRITIVNGSEESIKYHVLDFPILFKFRNRFGDPKKNKKELPLSWEASFGPTILFFNNTSNYNVNINFEGLYQIDTLSQSQFTYYPTYDNNSTYNLELTGTGLNSQSSLPGVDTVFNFLNANGYDFAYNKNYNGQDKKANRVSVAINANFYVNYKATESLSLKIGISILAAPLPNRSEGYEPIQNTTDTYKSFYQSKTNSFYMTGGINAGIIIEWR